MLSQELKEIHAMHVVKARFASEYAMTQMADCVPPRPVPDEIGHHRDRHHAGIRAIPSEASPLPELIEIVRAALQRKRHDRPTF
jgi:hypothetical protein